MSVTWVDYIAQMIMIIFAFAVVLSVHEAAHAGMAFLLGDDTAKKMGRLSLNPMVHIDPVGLLCLLIFRIGWARPVIFDHRNFKKPKLYSVITAYAGPFSNFVLTLVMLVCMKYFPYKYVPVAVSITFAKLFEFIAQISVMLGVFNLIPLPPLDGSHLLMALFMKRFPGAMLFLYRYSMIIILALFFLFPPFTNYLLRAIDLVYGFLYSFVF